MKQQGILIHETIAKAVSTGETSVSTGEAAVSNALALALLSLTDDGVVATDPQGGVVETNHAAAAMLGWSGAASTRGRSIDALLERAEPSDPFGARLTGAEVRERAIGAPLGVRVRLHPPRGALRIVRVSVAPMGDGALLLLLRDLSPLAAAEDLAHRYKRTADMALDGIYLVEPDSLRILYANDGAARRSGWSREALDGQLLTDVIPLLDGGSVREAIGGDDHPDQHPSTVPTVLRARDGELRPVDVLLQRLDLESGDSPLLAVVRDAAERVESQAKLQRLVQQERSRSAELEAMLAAIGDAVIVCDADGDVTLANPATQDVFGRARIRTYAEFLATFEDPEGRAPQLGATERQGPVELMLRGHAGRWLEVSAFPVDGPSETAHGGTIVLARDVTAARETRRMREAFLGILSHELRTPVTTILAGSKVLRRRGRLAKSTRDELVADIEAESERLYRLVEDLLVLARFEEQPPDAVADEPLLLQRILPGLLTSEEARWPGRTFTLAVPTGLTTVRGDRTYVEQVVRNLLGNAAKYSPPAERIDVDISQVGGHVQVRILDRGPGIAADEAERLFDLFYRSPETVDTAAGAGIGLFVCRRLIEAMGGRIWARPRDGGGAEFGFALRALDEEDE